MATNTQSNTSEDSKPMGVRAQARIDEKLKIEDERIPNAETIAAFEEANDPDNLLAFESVDEAFDKILKD